MEENQEDDQEMQRVAVIGLMGGEGQPNVVLHLFPSSQARLMAAVKWAKAHPEAEHVQIVLHGAPPDALVMTLPRTALLALVADMAQQEHGVTLQ